MAQSQTRDERSNALKIKMAKHFAEFEADYRDADWCSIVYEDDEKVIIADHRGYEFSEWSEDSAAGEDFSQIMHDLANEWVERRWPADYPVVFDKLESKD